jgi:DNA (cytosine-5)-methyltransferase 1
MRELSLFTGGGGGVYASLLLGHQIVGYVEYNEYCQKIIRQRIEDGIFDDAPIFGDIREFDGSSFCGTVDLVSGGFPCQPFSIAGRKKGADDTRNMWPETIRVIKQVKPEKAFLENVPGLLHSGYFGQILNDLSEAGYDAKWITLSAGQCGAPHKRERLWILANARREQREERPNKDLRSEGKESIRTDAKHFCQDIPKSECPGLERYRKESGRTSRAYTALSKSCWWESEPDVGRVANGVADRKHRLTAIGNGQVPIVAFEAYKLLTKEARDD